MAPHKENYQYESLESGLGDEEHKTELLPDFRLISKAENLEERRTIRQSFLTRVALVSSCLINIFLVWRVLFAPLETVPGSISRSPYGMLKPQT